MGYDLQIAGLTEDTFGMATSVTFANKTAMALLMGVSPNAASYVMVQPEPNVDTNTLTTTIREMFPDISILTQEAFVESDQEMIRQMGADIIQMMNLIAYVIGILVIGITIYTSTLERTQEYGVLKAIGAKPAQLLQLVLSQSFISAAAGYLVGIVTAYGLANIVMWLVPEMPIVLEPSRWLAQAPMLLLVAAIASMLPMIRILRIDPLIVFKA